MTLHQKPPPCRPATVEMSVSPRGQCSAVLRVIQMMLFLATPLQSGLPHIQIFTEAMIIEPDVLLPREHEPPQPACCQAQFSLPDVPRIPISVLARQEASTVWRALSQTPSGPDIQCNMRIVNTLRPAGSAGFYSLEKSKFLSGMHLSVVSKQRQSSSALPSATRSAMQPVLVGLSASFPETGCLSAERSDR